MVITGYHALRALGAGAPEAAGAAAGRGDAHVRRRQPRTVGSLSPPRPFPNRGHPGPRRGCRAGGARTSARAHRHGGSAYGDGRGPWALSPARPSPPGTPRAGAGGPADCVARPIRGSPRKGPGRTRPWTAPGAVPWAPGPDSPGTVRRGRSPDHRPDRGPGCPRFGKGRGGGSSPGAQPLPVGRSRDGARRRRGTKRRGQVPCGRAPRARRSVRTGARGVPGIREGAGWGSGRRGQPLGVRSWRPTTRSSSRRSADSVPGAAVWTIRRWACSALSRTSQSSPAPPPPGARTA